jgi:hypothetical protein
LISKGEVFTVNAIAKHRVQRQAVQRNRDGEGGEAGVGGKETKLNEKVVGL